jgi:ABC-type sugar transport system ATPase subunit
LPRTTDNLLELRQVTKRYPGVTALRSVSVTFASGEIHGLAGENGAGKSTLVKVVSGAVTPDEGEIRVDGRRMRFRSPRDALRVGISVVHQELADAPHLSVTENVLLGRLPSRFGVVDWSGAHREASSALRRLGADIDVRRRIAQLPLGARQLAEIARALLNEAQVLLLDEPSAILGERDLEILFSTIRSLADRGITCIYISHHLDELFELTDRVTVLKDGESAGTYETSQLSTDQLVKLMTGRDLRRPARDDVERSGPPILQVNDLTRRGEFTNVSCEVRPGEIVGLAGLVGAGRTGVLRAIAGADSIDSGSIRINGERAKIRSPRDARRYGIGYLPEDRKVDGLLLNRSVRENLGLASLADRSRLGIISKALDIRLLRAAAEKVDLRFRTLGQTISTLSGGNQQKTLLARWLTARSRVLLLDEPTRGIDVGAKAEVHRLMQQLAKEGTAILMVSNDIGELISVADRVIVMRNGRVAGHFSGSGITEDNIMHSVLVESVAPEPEASS